MARSPMPVAVVLGDIELIRPLAMVGIPCAVVCGEKDPARYSRQARYIGSWTVNDSPAALLQLIEAFADTQSSKPVLFYQWDAHLNFVSRFRDVLAQRFRFVLDTADNVERFLDKQEFHRLALDLELPVPPTKILDPGGDVESIELDFPIMIKPVNRIDDRWFEAMGGAKAARVDRREDLLALGPTLKGLNEPIVAQRLIPGPESRIESYHVYVDAHGSIAGEFSGKKIRTYPVHFGATTSLTTTNAPDVIRLGQEVIEKTKLRGVAKLDFKRDEDGSLYLLEINPRFNLWHHVGARAGVNLPELVYHDLCAIARPELRTAEAEVSWCSPSDALAVERTPVALARWARWAATCEVKGLWSFDDPMPFLSLFARRLKSAATSRSTTSR